MRQVAQTHLENLLAQHRGGSWIGGDDRSQIRKRLGEVLQHLGLGTGIGGTTFIVGSVGGHKSDDRSPKDTESRSATTLVSNAEPGRFRYLRQALCRLARNLPGSMTEAGPQALLDLGQQLLDAAHALDQVVVAQRVGQPHEA